MLLGYLKELQSEEGCFVIKETQLNYYKSFLDHSILNILLKAKDQVGIILRYYFSLFENQSKYSLLCLEIVSYV